MRYYDDIVINILDIKHRKPKADKEKLKGLITVYHFYKNYAENRYYKENKNKRLDRVFYNNLY